MTVPLFEIYIDGKPYCGFGPDNVYPQNVDYGSSIGFHSYNHNRLNVLKIGTGEPKELYGVRSLNSAIERIVNRLKAGLIDFDEIQIVRKQEA